MLYRQWLHDNLVQTYVQFLFVNEYTHLSHSYVVIELYPPLLANLNFCGQAETSKNANAMREYE